MRFLKMRIWTCLLTAAVLLAVTLSLAGFGTAMASGTNGYTYVWQNPVEYGEQVFSTNALSNNAVWSVGAYGCIEYWNGTTVTKQASGTTNHLYGVSAYDATHVWAVGEARTILFYNGTSWAAQAAPSLGYSYDLYAVSAGANNRVWAVGGYDGFKNAVILYYNGTSWTAQLTLATGGFTDVWAYNATNVWAVGGSNGWTYRYNGTSWTQVNDGSAHAPYQVSAYSTTAVWAVDWDGTMLYSTNAGTTWNAAPTPPNTGTVYGTSWPSSVSAYNATHIYAVGWGGSIAMYNGTSWATQASGTTNDLNDVDAYSTSYIYTAGDAQFRRYSTPMWIPLSGGTTSNLYAASGLDANNVWTVGTNVATYGNIQSTSTGGNIWTTQSSGLTNTLYGVADLDSSHVWVVGQNYVRFWNGSTWTTQVSGVADTVTSTFAVGTQPRSMGVNTTTNKIYVANNGSNNVSVIDGATDTVTKTITVGTSPRGVCVNSTSNKIYVANNGSNNVSVIDGSTDTVSKTVTVGTTPYRLCVNPATNKIYVANYGTNNVSVINGVTDTVTTTVGVGTGPIAADVNSTTNRIYVANYTGNNVTIINGTTDTVSKTVTVGTNPYDVAVNSSTNKIYVPNSGSANVSLIDGSTDTVTKTITVGTNPYGVGVNSSTNKIYVTNYGSNNVSVIDGSADTVASTVTVGTQPFDAGVNSTTSKIYVANYGSNNVSVINGKDRTYYCVTAAATNRVWVGSDDGWIRYYDGNTWVIQNPDSQYSTYYYGISAADTTHVWAVGASGEIAYWNGTSWAKQAGNTTNTLRAVTTLNSSTAWAVGDAGTIRYTSNAGATWQTQASGTTQNLLGVSAADATHVWAVGMGGTILFYDGTSWTSQTSPTTNTLWAVYAHDANNAWAVGDAGTILFADPPFIKTCSPKYCAPGKTMDVEVIGGYTNFQTSTPTLSFGSGVSVVPGSMNVVDNTRILATVKVDADAALGPRDVNAVTAGETPIPLAGGFVVGTEPKPPKPPKPASTACYLAEGSTAWGFQTRIAVMNPNDTAVTIRPTFMTKDGPLVKPNITLPARSTRVIDPMADYNLITDFSTRIECLEGKTIAVDRTMSWLGKGATAPEGHSSVGVSAPASTWYLAEGSSAWGFECWTLIQNPNAKPANCKITYMRDGATPVTVTKTVPANSRSSFNMADDIGSADASIKISADVPVIAERSMYRNNRREGSNSIGTTAPSQDYYLAEGSTAWGFATYVLIQNPNSIPTDVTVTYNTASGPVQGKPLTIPARSRATVKVNDTAPNMDLSTHVHGTQPIIAERAMYWDTSTGQACHDSIGMSSPHRVFYLPGGQSGYGFERWFTTWTLIQNPNNADVQVKISYLTYNGSKNATLKKTVPANSRISINMADKITDATAGVVVECTTAGRKIMVERSTYWDTKPGGSSAGVNTIGASSD